MTRIFDEPEGTLVYTDNQTDGKGQRGNVWVTEPGKNILMSVLLRPKFLSPTNQFYLNLIAGLAIVDTLKDVSPREIFLKWPNDVYINGKKISGVLIESNLRGNSVESAVLGIGINVNQKGFGINTATSLFLESQKEFDRYEIIENLLVQLEKWYLRLRGRDFPKILENYHRLLMWKGEIHLFKSGNQEFDGEIIGIDKNGNLVINVDEKLRKFGVKEVEFIS